MSLHRTVVVVTICVAAGLASRGVAGPLDPPPGPITGTLKPLSEVEPRIAINAVNTPGDVDSVFRIAAPGSYYLTGNIAGAAGKHGIEIASPGVTIDLMGHELLGGPGSLDAITNTALLARNIGVRNGSIRHWGEDGVDLLTAMTLNADVRGVRVYNVTGDGIRVGQVSTVTGCSTNSGDGDGVVTDGICTVSACESSQNGGAGFHLGFASTITGCASTGNLGDGIVMGSGGVATSCSAGQNDGDGVVTGFGSTITGCRAGANNGHGFIFASDCVVTSCSSVQSGGNGFTGAFGCVLVGCTAASGAADGFEITSDCTLKSCVSRFNVGHGIEATGHTNQFVECAANANDGNGIVSLGSNARVHACTAAGNELNGVLLGFRCTVSDCLAVSNVLDGIQAANQGLIAGNHCNQNGEGGDGAGIHVTGTDCRIEGNECSNADRGIDVDAAGNLIVRNTCSGNAINYALAANNVFGPILNRSAPASAAVNGSVAASSLGTTDANANFAY